MVTPSSWGIFCCRVDPVKLVSCLLGSKVMVTDLETCMPVVWEDLFILGEMEESLGDTEIGGSMQVERVLCLGGKKIAD